MRLHTRLYRCWPLRFHLVLIRRPPLVLVRCSHLTPLRCPHLASLRVSQHARLLPPGMYVGMDQWTMPLRRVVTVANRKGGVLKSSLCRNVAAVAAASQYRVLVVDGDPQGNLSEIDFALEGDRGRGLAMALQYGTDLQTLSG